MLSKACIWTSGVKLDVVVFGATGFVGRLVAGYLAGAAPAQARIGLGGRSVERLAAVRDGLGAPAAGWPLLMADLAGLASLPALARACRRNTRAGHHCRP